MWWIWTYSDLLIVNRQELQRTFSNKAVVAFEGHISMFCTLQREDKLTVQYNKSVVLEATVYLTNVLNKIHL